MTDCGGSAAVGQSLSSIFQDVLLRTRSQRASFMPDAVFRQTVWPSGMSWPLPRHVQFSLAIAVPAKPKARKMAHNVVVIRMSASVTAAYHDTGNAAKARMSGSVVDDDRNVIGGFLPCADMLVDFRRPQRFAASGDISRWSMRMPLFFCQAPAW
jgi:hypothetical protein